MPIRSWKNWILFAAGLITLVMPYAGIPRGIKDFFFVICGLTVLAIAVNLLWPYEPSRHSVHGHGKTAAKRRPTHRSRELAQGEIVPDIVNPIETPHEEAPQ